MLSLFELTKDLFFSVMLSAMKAFDPSGPKLTQFRQVGQAFFFSIEAVNPWVVAYSPLRPVSVLEEKLAGGGVELDHRPLL